MATLKTFDPPLSALEGRRFAGARRRGKHLLFPTDDGELVLHIHLMSAGRVRFLEPGAKGPKTSAFRLRLEDGGELILTEGGPKKRAKVGVFGPRRSRPSSSTSGPRLRTSKQRSWGKSPGGESRRLHPLLRDQRAIVGIGRAWSNEILNRAKLSPCLPTDLSDEEIERLSRDDPRADGLRPRTPSRRRQVTRRRTGALQLGEPCPNCGTPIARVDFEEHTIFYCPDCQTGGRVLKISGCRGCSGSRIPSTLPLPARKASMSPSR